MLLRLRTTEADFSTISFKAYISVFLTCAFVDSLTVTFCFGLPFIGFALKRLFIIVFDFSEGRLLYFLLAFGDVS